MIKSKKKRGFTIVELVIVIAVIGILSAILIPVFSGLVAKANLAADSVLVDSINKQLQISEVEDGKNTTMYDALQDAKTAGFLVGNINARSSNTLVWDQEIDRFALLDAENQVIAGQTVNANKKVKLWKIYSSVPQLEYQVYSIYYSGSETIASQNLKVGFDAGESENVEKLYYSNSNSSQEVIIRTNGGTLTVNAPLDTVKHFGNADKVDVQEIANASYHEFGDVDLVKVKMGHVELEQGSAVLGIYVYNDSTETVKATSFENIKITVNQGVEVPALSRSAVAIQDGGTKVCTIVTDEAKDVYLFNEGIYEQIKVVDEGKAITDESATWADDNSNSANTQTAAQQLANELNATVTVNDVEYTVAVNTESENRELVVTVKDTGAAADPSVVNSVKENAVNQSGSTEEAAVANLPLRGDGLSWETAFEIYDYATMQKVNEFYNVGYRYFKVVIEKTNNGYVDCQNWEPVYLNGSFDGKGVIFNNLDSALFARIKGESSVVKNFTINANIVETGGVGAVTYKSISLDLTIDSVDVHGTIISDSWVTPYVEFGPGPSYSWYLTVKNCVSDATLVATSGVASGFVGHPYDDVSNGSVNGKSLITIIDSAYIGNMSATGSLTGTNFKYFTINGNDNRVKTSYSDTFIDRLGFNPEGALYAVPTNAANYPVVVNDDGSKTFFCGNYGKNVVDNYIKPYSKAQLNTTAKASLPANVGDVFTVTKVSGATKAVVSLLIAPNDSNNYGSYLGTYMTEEIDITAIEANSSFTSENVKYFTININSGVTSATGVSGDIFNVVNPYYGINAHNGATVQIVQFDTNGNVLNITSIKIATAHAAE